MKRIIFASLLFLCFSTLFLISCTSSNTVYTVTYYVDGNIYSVSYVEEASSAIFPAEPSKPGSKFKGWYYKGALWDEETIVSNDMELTAEWENETALTPSENISAGGSENAGTSIPDDSDKDEASPPASNTPPSNADEESADNGNACEHISASWKTVLPSTCKSNGEEQLLCNSCGQTIATNVIPMKAHNFKEETADSVCDKQGFTKLTCRECGFEDIEYFGEPLGHKLGDWYVYIEPSCSSYGVKRQDCKMCGYFVKETIPKSAHSLSAVSLGNGNHTVKCENCEYSQKAQCSTIESTVEPTCENIGYTEHFCELCKYTYKTYAEALGHLNKNGFCQRCSYTEYEIELSSDESYYIFKSCGSSSATDIIIPEEYMGLPISEIAYRAFFGNENIVSVYIPKSINTIGAFAFSYCNALIEIEFEEKTGWAYSENRSGDGATELPALTQEYALKVLTDGETGYPEYFLIKK